MILSILIPSLHKRSHLLKELFKNIESQYQGLDVEVISEVDNGEKTTGEKRNILLSKARGEYVWFVDDDDYIYPGAVKKIFKCISKNPDVIGINGVMTTDGNDQKGWEIRLGHPYKAVMKNGKEYYLRFPNHITPMKREHAIKAKFPHKNQGEDYEWACKIKDLGILKTQEVIDEPVYHYRFISKK